MKKEVRVKKPLAIYIYFNKTRFRLTPGDIPLAEFIRVRNWLEKVIEWKTAKLIKPPRMKKRFKSNKPALEETK